MHALEREVDGIALEHHDAIVGGLRLHVVTAGQGEPVLLLHGFPDCWLTWRRQMAALARAGRRAIAPDLRGYAHSEKPHGIDAYAIDVLVADVAGLAAWAGRERIDTVGHDWGGIIAWYAAMHRPETVGRLAVLNAPHPAAYRRDVLRTSQWLRSWYGAFFQIPGLAERLLGARRAEAVARAHGDAKFGPPPSDEELELYREAFSQPGALTSAIHYYRALARRRFAAQVNDFRPVAAPTLLLWGERDPFLVPSLTDGLDQWVPSIRVQRFADAGHWVHRDAADAVAASLVEFFTDGAPLASAGGVS